MIIINIIDNIFCRLTKKCDTVAPIDDIEIMQTCLHNLHWSHIHSTKRNRRQQL
jgi:hypothetical protein